MIVVSIVAAAIISELVYRLLSIFVFFPLVEICDWLMFWFYVFYFGS